MPISSTEMQQKIDKHVINMGRWDGIVNGDDTHEETTDNGPVPSVAKFFKDVGDQVENAVTYTAQTPSTAEKVQALINIGAPLILRTLSELTGMTVPPTYSTVRLIERVTGRNNGSLWARQTSEPAVPVRAKTQDASGTWFMLLPEKGEITVEQLGAESGFFIDANTRTIFNAMTTPSTTRTESHIRLIDQAVRRFMRIGVWAQVNWTVDAGLITFTPNSGTIRAEQYDAAMFIKAVYDIFKTSASTTGRLITATELDVTNAINASNNADYIQDAVTYGEIFGVNVKFTSPYTYPIAKSLRAFRPVLLKGLRHRTCIYAIDSNAYNNPVFWTGEVGKMAEGVWIEDLIFDGNIRRLAGSAGTVTGAPSGSVVCMCFQRGGGANYCYAYDGRKHCFDITGSTYPTSGSAGTVANQSTEMSDGVVLRNCYAEGAGDDEFTLHSSIRCGLDTCYAMFNTGGDTNNSIAFEYDDGVEHCWGYNLYAMYCGSGLQVKGHNAGRPANNVFIDRIDAYKCNTGIMIFHTDFGGSGYPRWSGAKNVTVLNATIRHPMAWISSETIKTGIRYYGYDSVNIQAKFIQEGADPAYYNTGSASQGVLGFYNSAGRGTFDIEIEGFASGVYGVNITVSASGPFTFKNFVCMEGPLTAFRQQDTATVYTILESFNIFRTSGGTTGISCSTISPNPMYLKIGHGWVNGYTTAADARLGYT